MHNRSRGRCLDQAALRTSVVCATLIVAAPPAAAQNAAQDYPQWRGKSGDMVYVFARREGNEVLLAIDAATGAERWRSAYPLPYTSSSPTVAHGSGPKATPLFHEGKLFTLGISGILSAFDAKTGMRLWQTAAPAEVPF